MVSYFNRLESLIEKWQSRRKTIEISQVEPAASSQSDKSKFRIQGDQTRGQVVRSVSLQRASLSSSTTGNISDINTSDKENVRQPQRNQQQQQQRNYPLKNNGDKIFLATETDSNNIKNRQPSKVRDKLSLVQAAAIGLGEQQDDCATEASSVVGLAVEQVNCRATKLSSSCSVLRHAQSSCLLYVSVGLFLLTSLSPPPEAELWISGGGQRLAEAAEPVRAARQYSSSAAMSSLLSGEDFTSPPSFGFADIIKRLAAPGARIRWIRVPGPESIREPPHRRYQTRLTRTMNRISQRIGARNTIRVHNAFRDLAWRLLSSLSMPTPVIYELRRQHLYSPEDDLMNDSFYAKNTTKTIRSKRQLFNDLWPLPRTTTRPDKLKQRADFSSGDLANWTGSSSDPEQHSRFRRATSNRDDDEDEPDSLRSRVRLRLEDLINLSRRSLFGRVVRVPSLFPFKRQEGGDKKPEDGDSGGFISGIQSRRLRRRRRKKEAERQMISIDGKQYYVNDDGELKEWNDQVEQ